MRKIFTFLLLALTLTGCSVQTKQVPTSPATKVTVAVNLPNKLQLDTIGTTIFNNKSMSVNVPGTPLATRVRSIVDKHISNSGKSTLVRSNGSLDSEVLIKRNGWTGKADPEDMATLTNKAKALGANLLVIVSGATEVEPFYGTTGSINNIGVLQRSVFGIKNSTSFSLLYITVIDTSTGTQLSSYRLLTNNDRKNKPWITPESLPNATEMNFQ